MLTRALVDRFGARAVPQFRGAVPGRCYVIDVALPDARLAIEIDGWQHHGRYLADFRHDRQRDRDLLLAGWRTIRFSAGEVRRDPAACVSVVERVLSFPTARDGR